MWQDMRCIVPFELDYKSFCLCFHVEAFLHFDYQTGTIWGEHSYNVVSYSCSRSSFSCPNLLCNNLFKKNTVQHLVTPSGWEVWIFKSCPHQPTFPCPHQPIFSTTQPESFLPPPPVITIVLWDGR